MPTQQPADWASRATIRDPSLPHQIRLSQVGDHTAVSCNCLVQATLNGKPGRPRSGYDYIAICAPGDLEGMWATYRLFHDENGMQV